MATEETAATSMLRAFTSNWSFVSSRSIILAPALDTPPPPSTPSTPPPPPPPQLLLLTLERPPPTLATSTTTTGPPYLRFPARLLLVNDDDDDDDTNDHEHYHHHHHKHLDHRLSLESNARHVEIYCERSDLDYEEEYVETVRMLPRTATADTTTPRTTTDTTPTDTTTVDPRCSFRVVDHPIAVHHLDRSSPDRPMIKLKVRRTEYSTKGVTNLV